MATTSETVTKLASRVVGDASFTLAHVLYPEIEPYTTGMLDVGDGQLIYYEESGNPDGIPAVFLHGGPGGGGGIIRRRFFNPERYRIVCFDQRGCGDSTPHASDPACDMSVNTTWHLVADIEKLREHLGVDTWLVFGGSWGSALALAYAETHPERVSALVLRGIFTLRQSELDWFYNGGVAPLVPQWWDVFTEPLRRAGHDLSRDNIVAYHHLLWIDDAETARSAAVAWSTWEAATVGLQIDAGRLSEMGEDHHALAFARIENHYFVNHGWFSEGQLIADADRLRQIPGVIVQGAYDLCCPPITAVELHDAWPEADLRLVLAGHAANEPLTASELVAATDHFAALLSS